MTKMPTAEKICEALNVLEEVRKCWMEAYENENLGPVEATMAKAERLHKPAGYCHTADNSCFDCDYFQNSMEVLFLG